jgi:hypothetical protein
MKAILVQHGRDLLAIAAVNDDQAADLKRRADEYCETLGYDTRLCAVDSGEELISSLYDEVEELASER